MNWLITVFLCADAECSTLEDCTAEAPLHRTLALRLGAVASMGTSSLDAGPPSPMTPARRLEDEEDVRVLEGVVAVAVPDVDDAAVDAGRVGVLERRPAVEVAVLGRGEVPGERRRG